MQVSEHPLVFPKTSKKKWKESCPHGSIRQVQLRKKVTQLEATARTKDARHLKKIEELRAIARNKHELLEAMIRTLEQQLQQQKDHTDRFIADWQNR